jgi:hypothetical protein
MELKEAWEAVHAPPGQKTRTASRDAQDYPSGKHVCPSVHKSVQQIRSSAICGERKQTPRIHVTHTKHRKP